jgi:cysteine-rich repeat protein
MRFVLDALPRASVIDRANLEITVVAPGGPVSLHRVLEPWTEGQSSPETPFDPERVARFFAEEGLFRLAFDTPTSVWVTEPEGNFGLALTGEGTISAVAAREGGTPATLSVDFHLPGDLGPILDGDGGFPCGNGVIEAPEECDDANSDEEDGCTRACRIARCGDGVVRRGVEDCDDGNTLPDDGCSADCLDCSDPNARATFLGDNGHCYAWFDERRGYSTGEGACDNLSHGMLASFESRTEQDMALAGLDFTAASAWIGLSDRTDEDLFRWASGSGGTSYTAWASGQPAAVGDDGEDCVTVDAAGRWTDRLCSETHGYLCERYPWTYGAEGRAYLPVNGILVDWFEARLECMALGGHLVSLNDAAENTLVDSFPGSPIWTGLTEAGHEGTLLWESGEGMTYQNFTSPPDLDGQQFCVVQTSDAVWSLLQCTGHSRRYVCENR